MPELEVKGMVGEQAVDVIVGSGVASSTGRSGGPGGSGGLGGAGGPGSPGGHGGAGGVGGGDTSAPVAALGGMFKAVTGGGFQGILIFAGAGCALLALLLLLLLAVILGAMLGA